MVNRQELEVRYKIFDRFALGDQRHYYQSKLDSFRKARGQVNMIRASMGLATVVATVFAITMAPSAFNETCTEAIRAVSTAQLSGGIESAAAATVQQLSNCRSMQLWTSIAAGLSIILPAIGGFFGALLGVYQWDKFVQIYKDAQESLEAADAQLTDRISDIDDERFISAYIAYTEGTLEVMASETSQWGQSVKTPAQIEAFVKRQVERASRAQRGITGEGGKEFENPDGSFG
ncbi:MAG: hypothetical protein IPM16_12270 [Chloroflexi bacterium]|nr:hypothetical protein [Chloroflexota bacterium]